MLASRIDEEFLQIKKKPNNQIGKWTKDQNRQLTGEEI